MNDLAAALAPGWTAEWAWADRGNLRLIEAYEWLVSERTLGIELNDLRVFFRDDGRRFKDKKATDEPLPSVAQREALLRDPNVQAAKLGTSREDIDYTLRVAGGESLYERVVANLPDAADELRVESVTIKVPGRDHTAVIELDRRLIDTLSNATAITTLIQLAHRFFAHGDESEWSRVRSFLRAGRAQGPTFEEGLDDPEGAA